MAASSSTIRRTDLDWLRVLLFGGLITYHLGLMYASWSPFALKSDHRTPWVEMALLTTHPWRMCLLFLISGVATRFAFGKLGASKLLVSRSVQLLPPLLFGMALVVPIQAWLSLVENLGYDKGFWAFLPEVFLGRHSIDVGGRSVPIPVYAHLWFVCYLWIYVTGLALVLKFAPRAVEWAQRRLERVMTGPGFLIWPVSLMLVLRLTLGREFGINLGLVNDWYNHAISLGMFLFGFMIARTDRIWDRFVALRWPALVLAVAAWALYAALAWNKGIPELVERNNPIMHLLYPAERWFAIIAVLGFARRWLGGGQAVLADGPALRYLTGAMFTYYIVHQPAMLLLMHHLRPLALPAGVEFAVILGGTMAACALSYEFARSLGGLGIVLGAPRGRPAPEWVGAVRAAAASLLKNLKAPVSDGARSQARYGLEEQAQAR